VDIEKQLLIIGYVWPEPDSSAAGQRMMHLIRLFLAHDYIISFACPALKSEFKVDLTTLGIKEIEIKINDPSFDELLIKLNPSHVLFDRFMMFEQFAWRIEEKCPKTFLILDTEDLHSLRDARQTAFKKGLELNESTINSDKYYRELSCLLRADLNLITSKYELQFLEEKNIIPKESLFYLPLIQKALSTEDILSWPSFKERSNVIFIGNFLHEPNWDTVKYLKQLWLKIKKNLPNVEIHIYGAYMSDKHLQLSNVKEGFILKGRADNPSELVSKYRLTLAPIRFGAGIKGKLLESMKAGTPSITSSVGAEGIGTEKNWPGFIVKSEEDFLQKTFHLYSNKESWMIAQGKGTVIINEDFTAINFEEELISKIAQLTKGNTSSLLIKLLLFQSKKGDKYFSKWIEEKNK